MEACCFMYGARTASFPIFLVPLGEILLIRLEISDQFSSSRDTSPPVAWL